jgi:predicted GIY-YIG superfamily endonuclease
MLYILKIVPPMHHAQYYTGYCADDRFEERLAEHLDGRGATIIRRALEAGHQIQPVLTFPGNRTDERRLKNRHNTPKFVEQTLINERCI